jgi:acyl-coenzyme A thioesterase PaaI-like protein
MPVWNEPVRGGLPDPSFYGLPGMEQAQALLRGLVPTPPYGRLVGHRMTQVAPGSATATATASPWLQHTDGTLDLKTTIDGALHCAVLSGAAPATEVRTATLSVNHLRPCTTDSGTVIARARVVHAGPTFTLAEAIVEDAMGRAVADANASFLLRPIDPPPPPGATPRDPVDEPRYPDPDPYARPLPAALGPLPSALFDEVDMLTLVRRMIAGELPNAPVCELFGMRYVDVGHGHLLLALRTSGWLCDFYRDVSAGAIATVAHLALGGVVATTAPAARRVGVVEQSITFFRPVLVDGQELLARARVVHGEPELVASTVEVTDADGQRVALGHQTSVLIKRHRRRSAAERPVERILATVVFTDIVGSTEQAEKLGDAEWRELLGAHDDMVRKHLAAFKGREVKRPATAFWPPSPPRPRPCTAPGPSATACRPSVCRSGPVSTPANAKWSATTWRGSPSTSPPGCNRPPTLVRSSCPPPSGMSSPAPVCASRPARHSHSKASTENGASSASSTDSGQQPVGVVPPRLDGCPSLGPATSSTERPAEALWSSTFRTWGPRGTE